MATKKYKYLEVDVKLNNKTAIQIINEMAKKGYRFVLCRMDRLLYFEK